MTGSDRRDEIRAHLESTRAHLEATNAKIEARAGRNLFFAVASGLVFAAVFLVSILWVKQLFVLLVAILVSVALVELASAFRTAGRRVPRVGAVVGGLTVVVGTYFWGSEGMLLGLFAGSGLIIVWRLVEGLVVRWETPKRTLLRDVLSGVFALVYVSFLASFSVLLIEVEGGEWWIFALVLIVVSVDIGAYAAGVTLGKHKMTPRISPNKTWEGFGGAAVAATAAGVVMAIFALDQPWWVGVLLGVVVLFTATGGDLTESLIKRNLGVKDMSSWIPGHGGFLDRLDSLLPSAVGVYGVALALGVVA
ncbi:MAG: phosphatidate cytidylyltransferase [Leucobacter sp.]